MFFPRVLARRETRTAASKIWIEVIDSLSYDDNHYAKSALLIGAVSKGNEEILHIPPPRASEQHPTIR